MAKPKTHIEDPSRDAPKGASFSLCGVFLYQPAMVDNADPSCQKCIRFRHSKRWKDRPPTNAD